MKEEKQIISVCCICDKVTKPEEAIGLTGKWIKADIEVFKLQDIYTISHGYCKPCYETARSSLIEELEKLPKI